MKEPVITVNEYKEDVFRNVCNKLYSEGYVLRSSSCSTTGEWNEVLCWLAIMVLK